MADALRPGGVLALLAGHGGTRLGDAELPPGMRTVTGVRN